MADSFGKSYFEAGLYNILLHKKLPNGLAAGQMTDAQIADTTPASTIVSEALFIKNSLVSIGQPGQARITVSEFGGQQFLRRKDLGPGELEDHQLAISRRNPSIDFITAGALVNSTRATGVTMGGTNNQPLTLNDVGAIFTVGSTEVDSVTLEAVTTYTHYWQPAFTAAKVPNEYAGIQSSTTNPYNAVYNLAVSKSAQLQNGELLEDLEVGLTADFRFPMTTIYKNYGLVTAVMADAQTTFTLPRLPLLSDATADGRNIITLNGVPTAVTSIDTGTGAVTIPASTAGDVWVIWYPLADQS